MTIYLTLPELVHLFDRSCTWNELLSLYIRDEITDSKNGQILDCIRNKKAEDESFIDYLNEKVSRGYFAFSTETWNPSL